MTSTENKKVKGGSAAVMEEKSKPYICPCVFWRDKGAEDFTCLIENEIKRLHDIVQINNGERDPIKWYKKVMEVFNCNDDKCVLEKLEQKGVDAKDIFKEAIPVMKVESMEQWLSTIEIDFLLKGLEQEKPWYKYMGVETWSGFDENSDKLNTSSLVNTILQEKTKTVFGYVLNQCHKFSSGKHWCALVFVRQPDSKICCYYYDSQGKTGPALEKISCDCHLPSSDEKYEYYKNFPNKFDQWWEQLKIDMKQSGLNFVNQKEPFHNVFFTQGDQHSCGYHAIMFNFLIVDCMDPKEKKNLTADKVAVTILGVLDKNKSLDNWIKEFQAACFVFEE